MKSRRQLAVRAALVLAVSVLLLAMTASGLHRHDGPPNAACKICQTVQIAALAPLAAVVAGLSFSGWRMPLLEPPLVSEPFLQSRHSRAPPA
jgi:hypothetical protein